MNNSLGDSPSELSSPTKKQKTSASTSQVYCGLEMSKTCCQPTNDFIVYERPTLQSAKPRSTMYKDKAKQKKTLKASFVELGMTRDEALLFLCEVQADMGSESTEVINCREHIERQYNTLQQSEKRQLIKLLTHKEGDLNNDVIACLPFLKKRSIKLLAKPERQERTDKIDLAFISQFMHDHCRYVNIYALLYRRFTCTLLIYSLLLI